jgi:hypothetical protein
MLRGVGELLLRRRAPGLRALPAAALEEPPLFPPARPGGAAPTAIVAPTRVAAASRGVMARPAMEVAPAGAAVLAAAKATTPAGAVAVAAEGAAPEGSAAAAAASASKVFLLRLLGGRPRFRGTGGITAGSFTLFWLPSGLPRLRPPDPLGAPAPAPLRALGDDIEGEGAEEAAQRRGRVKALGSGENPRELRDLKDDAA